MRPRALLLLLVVLGLLVHVSPRVVKANPAKYYAYDGTNDVIIVYTYPASWNVADDFSIDDIADEDDAQGWNQVEQLGDRSFRFSCGIWTGYMGYGGTARATLKDEDVTVVFDASCPSDLITVTEDSILEFGVLYDSGNRLGRDGVAMMSERTSATRMICGVENNVTINLYSSYFGTNTTASHKIESAHSSRFYECELDGVGFDEEEVGSLDFFRLDVHGAEKALEYAQDPDAYEDLFVYNSTYATYGFGTFSNCEFKNNSYLGYRVPIVSTDSYFVNCESNVWTWASHSNVAENYRQYTFDLTVTFTNGSYADGSNVTLSNAYLGTSDSWTLASNGSIPSQTLGMGHYNKTGGSAIYEYNPYNLTVSLDGFQTYSTLFDLTERTEWMISLLPDAETEESTERTTSGGGILDETLLHRPIKITRSHLLVCAIALFLGIWIGSTRKKKKKLKMTVKSVERDLGV